MRWFVAAPALAGLLLGAGPQVLRGQASASMPAAVTVVAGVAVNGVRDLDFGVLAPIDTRTVAPDAGALFSGSTSRNGRIVVSYQLPADLGSPDVTLSGWQGLHHDRNDPAGATAFVPAAPAGDFRMTVRTGEFWVWFGATVTATNAAPGTYSAPIVVSVVYN